uniref:Class I SAM-dependent methyltransferase n=1 Tax=Roseihalotalea indica TaxID=2867963 RepID=A0AA49GP64_9BACT|nr:class I SAM-dependent methyltransferase [Tunicatimonas sp. TK19036]
MLKKIFKVYSKNARANRGKLFNKLIKPSLEDNILDLGGGDGGHIATVIPYRENVTIADISTKMLNKAKNKYGFNTYQLDESGKLSFPAKYDVIFCSSVIEHVTVDKKEAPTIDTNSEFKEKSLSRQEKFAKSIRSSGKSYYVQTPYKYFLIESHTWLPILFIFLPRKVQISINEFLLKSSFWPKKVRWLDFNLLTVKDMQMLFPDAQIIKEKSFGFTKSLIALKIDGSRKN